MTQFIIPESEEHWLELRTRVVTSTEVAALFDQSPYMTAFELWHRKAGKLDSMFEETERTRWGTRLQDAIAIGIAADEGWKVRRMNEFAVLSNLRMGSSFDYGILRGQSDTPAALLEIKNVDHWIAKEGWIVDKEDDGSDYIEAPVHIELQMQHQMMVSAIPECWLGALVGGNRILLTKRESDPVVQGSIRQAVAEFWASVDAGTPPVPNFERDAKVITRLYGYAEEGKVAQADDVVARLATEQVMLGRQMKELETKRNALKAEILTLIGDAEKVRWPGGSISAGMVAECEMSYTRKAYRGFRVTLKEPKAEKEAEE